MGRVRFDYFVPGTDDEDEKQANKQSGKNVDRRRLLARASMRNHTDLLAPIGMALAETAPQKVLWSCQPVVRLSPSPVKIPPVRERLFQGELTHSPAR
jgi:hypothetical protein